VERAARSVVSHRESGIAVTERIPGLGVARVDRAAVLGQRRRRQSRFELIQHAAGIDRRKLRAVADKDQLAARLIHCSAERRQSARVEHPGLVDDDRPRGNTAREQRVDRGRPPGERGSRVAESLGRGPRESHAGDVATRVVFDARHRVENHTLTSAGAAD
jgi:hypothetical protein